MSEQKRVRWEEEDDDRDRETKSNEKGGAPGKSNNTSLVQSSSMSTHAYSQCYKTLDEKVCCALYLFTIFNVFNNIPKTYGIYSNFSSLQLLYLFLMLPPVSYSDATKLHTYMKPLPLLRILNESFTRLKQIVDGICKRPSSIHPVTPLCSTVHNSSKIISLYHATTTSKIAPSYSWHLPSILLRLLLLRVKQQLGETKIRTHSRCLSLSL